MSTPIEEPWSPEPELRDFPPRRLKPSEYPDLNVPNVKIYTIAGIALLVVGLVLLVLGLARGQVALDLVGIVALVAGGGAMVLAPRKAVQVTERAERLVGTGQPVMARILSADNLTGDSVHGRSVKYQVTLPGGEIVHRDVNVDERALPKRLPANVTALMDMRTSDVELYCALPFRAIPKNPVPQPAAQPAQQQVQPGAGPGATQQQQQQPKSPSGYQGLPWE